MTVVKQGHTLEIGFKQYPIGRIPVLTPDQLQIEVLIQDTVPLKGLPVSLTRRDEFENGVVRTVQVFDGWVRSAAAMSERSKTTYSVITADNQVTSVLQQTLLQTVRSSPSAEELLVSDIQSRTGAALLVPDAQSLMAELLSKRSNQFSPSFIMQRLVESVMHTDAVELYNDMKNCVRELNRYRDGLPQSVKEIEKVAEIILSGSVKVEGMTGVETPYLWRSKNWVTLQVNPFHVQSTEVSIDHEADAADLFQKSKLTANLLYFLLTRGEQRTFPEEITESEFRTVWVGFMAGVPSGYYDYNINPVDIVNAYIDSALVFSDISVWYDYSAKKLFFDNPEYSAHKYLTNTLGEWVKKNETFFSPFVGDGAVDVEKYRSRILKSSFMRSGVNAGTLKYWNGRVNEKIIDMAMMAHTPRNPLSILNMITRRAGMDIMRRQLQFASEGSLANVLSTFYSAYFMRLDASYPMKGYTADGRVMTGQVTVNMNSSMGVAPSRFIPLELWQTDNFTSAARPDREEFYFFVRDKVIRDLIEKDAPPYLFNYRDGWGSFIEIGDMTDFFEKDYHNSLYRTPVINEVTIDRTLLAALTDQGRESAVTVPAAASVKNEFVDPVAMAKAHFDRKFKGLYDSMTGTSDFNTAADAAAGIGKESFLKFYTVYMKYFMQTGDPFIKQTGTGELASAILTSYSIFNSELRQDTAELGRWDETDIRKVGTFYPGADMLANLDLSTASARPEQELTDSIKNYILSSEYGQGGTGTPGSYTFSNFYEDFCRGTKFVYKSDKGFTAFVKYLHQVEGGDAINTLDGESIQVPSRYGLQIDKLMLFAKYRCGNTMVDRTEFRQYEKLYHIEALLNRKKKLDKGVSDADARPTRSECIAIINKVASSGTVTARLFRSFATFSEDEASEITYWVMFRGAPEAYSASLLKGERNIPPMKLLAVLADAYFHHGNHSKRFVRWYNDQEPRRRSTPAYTFSWGVMPDSDRKMWRAITGVDSLPSNTDIKDVCRMLAGKAGSIDVKQCVDSLIRYRQYIFLDANAVTSGFETNRLAGLIKFVNSITDTEYRTGSVSPVPPKGYESLMGMTVNMLVEDLERVPDPETYEGEVLPTGLPGNMLNFKPLLKSWLNGTPVVTLVAEAQPGKDSNTLDIHTAGLRGFADSEKDIRISIPVKASEIQVKSDNGIMKSQISSVTMADTKAVNETLPVAAAVIAYSYGAFMIRNQLYGDHQEMFRVISGVYSTFIGSERYNNAVTNAEINFSKIKLNRYKRPDVDINSLPVLQRQTFVILLNLYFIEEIMKDCVVRYRTPFIVSPQTELGDPVRKGMLNAVNLCTEMSKYVEKLIMSDNFLNKTGTAVDSALLRSPVAPVPEDDSVLDNMVFSTGSSGTGITGVKGYSITAGFRKFSGLDVTGLKRITPESGYEILRSSVVRSDSLDHAMYGITKLAGFHFFLKLYWKLTQKALTERLSESPEFVWQIPVMAQDVSDALRDPVYGGYTVLAYTLQDDYFGVNDKNIKAVKWGGDRVYEDGFDTRFYQPGFGNGTSLEKLKLLDNTISGADNVESIHRIAGIESLRSAAEVWKLLYAGRDSRIAVAFGDYPFPDAVNKKASFYTFKPIVLFDLSSNRDFIKRLQEVHGQDSVVPCVKVNGYSGRSIAETLFKQ